MPSPLESLRRLHALDEEIRTRKEAAEGIRKAVAARLAEADAADQAVLQERSGAKEARSREGLKEGELKALEAQIESWTVKLNTTRDNKEYQGIVHQIGTLKEQKGKLEEEVLGLIDGTAGLQAHLTEEEKRVSAARKAFEAWQAGQEAEVKRLEGEMTDKLAHRKEVSSGVAEDYLGRYERLRTSRGTALAGVVEEVCQGCHLGLTPNQINLLVQDSALVSCQSCGRILYPA